MKIEHKCSSNYNSGEQLVFNEQECIVQVMCSGCGERWLHEESTSLWNIWAIGFEAGAARASNAAMQIHAPRKSV